MKVILIILIILILLYYFTKSTESMVTCRSPEAIAAAKKYYDTRGQYKGVFLMDPISSAQVDATNCDIKYRPIPVNGSPRNDNEVDARRFTYDGNQVVLMGDWKSGFGNG